WQSRIGRAIGLTAGLYIVVLIGAIPVGMQLIGNRSNAAGPGFAAASPFWGVGYSSAEVGGTAGSGRGISQHAAWLVFWIAAYGLFAFGLLLATLKTFNRCLGRLDDSSPQGKPLPCLAKPATWLPVPRVREDHPGNDRVPEPQACDPAGPVDDPHANQVG